MKRLKTIPALLSLCLTLLLSSCSKTPPPAPEQVISLPPETVFTPCEQPELQGDTWGDAVGYTLALQTSLQICAGQVATLNQWREAAGRKQ
ncbi:Rz1-like lysis system protein LysC [Serratia sp. 1D1416]|uniref:Rz1-like lysis system protein LysC n=1 Tax=Serratia sp. 1D1416 TaxID=2447890 RepID=UPI001F5E1B0D|nr:Rz1-like lysis system protein LysC [Serratia sp. 1D1416]